MSYPEIIRRGDGPFDPWREVVWRATGETIGWLRRDESYSSVAWDAFDKDRTWLKGFGLQADAVRFLRSRWVSTEGET